MKSIKSMVVLAVVALVVAAALVVRSNQSAEQSPPPEEEATAAAPAPTLVELGSDKCTSCRAMIPVLEELESTHGCHLNVRSVDVWKDPAEGDRFGRGATVKLLGIEWRREVVPNATAFPGRPQSATYRRPCVR